MFWAVSVRRRVCPDRILSRNRGRSSGQGSWDAVFGMLGLIAGSWLYAEMSGSAQRRRSTRWGDLGKLTLYDIAPLPRSVTVAFTAVIITSLLFVIGSLSGALSRIWLSRRRRRQQTVIPSSTAALPVGFARGLGGITRVARSCSQRSRTTSRTGAAVEVVRGRDGYPLRSSAARAKAPEGFRAMHPASAARSSVLCVGLSG